MEVSSETRRKVRDFVIGEFGADFIQCVDLQMGFNSFGDRSFIVGLVLQSGQSFRDKGSELFHLTRNVRDIAGEEFLGLAPVLDIQEAKD